MIIAKIINLVKKFSYIFQQLYGGYKLQILILTALGFFGGLLEVVGVSILIPIFSLLTKQEIGDDRISQAIKWFFLHLNLNAGVLKLLVLISLVFIIKTCIVLLFEYLKAGIAYNYEFNTRNKLYNTIFQATWPFLSKQKIGYLELYLMARVKESVSLLKHICGIILIWSNLIIFIFAAINIDFFITVIVTVLGGAVLFIFKPLIRWVRLYAAQLLKVHKAIAHEVNENMLGLKSIKAMSIEQCVARVGEGFFKKFKHNKLKLYIIEEFYSRILYLIMILVICGIFGIFYMRVQTNFNFASFAVVIYLAQRIFNEVSGIGKWIQRFNGIYPDIADLINFKKQLTENLEKETGKKSAIFRKTLEFKNISFAYDSKIATILDGVNFYVNKGEVVGVIGSSGAGKTTVVDLLLRLFEPQKGEILIDGNNLNEINLQEWRQNIGYITQDLFLKNDTIENNIRFYNDGITQVDIAEAAKMANIYDFIQGLPKGFATIIGERGIRLSGGERQRIVFARILARKPQILILDEATSSLDNESEAIIQRAIETLKGKMTIIIIAHRLSTVMDADRLVVLERGGIVEEGAPSELLHNEKSYLYRMYKISNSKFAEI